MPHSSQNTASEYSAKHEPDIAKNMASLWEKKTIENDGGKLPPTFAKDPKDVAESVKRGNKHAAGATSKNFKSTEPRSGSGKYDADTGPPRALEKKASKSRETTEERKAKKHPVVETKLPLSSGLGSRNNSRKSDADAGPTAGFSRQKSVVEIASTFTKTAQTSEEIEEQVRKEVNKARAVERAQAGKTIMLIEEQIAALTASVSKLKEQVC